MWTKRPSSRSRTRRTPDGGPARPTAGTVTGIELQFRRSERVNIRIDGEYAFSLAAQEARHLRVGEQLDSHQVGELLERDAAEQAYQRALHFLAARPRSVFEVRRRLRGAGVDDQPASEGIDRLRRQGLLDDAQFATYWVAQRQAFKPRGPRALRSELRAKGIAAETMIPAICAAAEDQGDAACRAGLREARRQCAHGEREFTQALGKYLARRGFDYGVIRAAVAELWVIVQSEAAGKP